MSTIHRRNPDDGSLFQKDGGRFSTLSDIDREEQERQCKEQELRELREDMEYDAMRDMTPEERAKWEAEEEKRKEQAEDEGPDEPETEADKFRWESIRLHAALKNIVASAIRHRWKVNSDEPDTINEAMNVLNKYKEGKL